MEIDPAGSSHPAATIGPFQAIRLAIGAAPRDYKARVKGRLVMEKASTVVEIARQLPGGWVDSTRFHNQTLADPNVLYRLHAALKELDDAAG